MYISRMPHYGTISGDKRKVFVFADLDAAIEAAVMLCGSDTVFQCILYECDGKWYISSSDACMLSEYGYELSGSLWEPYLMEHGKTVAEGAAIERLVKAFEK